MDKNATFYQKLTAFYHNKGISFEYEPRIGGTKLSLEKVYELVQNMGGSSKVSDQNKWADIFEQCGSLPSSCVNGHFLMKQIYSRYLDAFERHERGEGSDETNTGFGNTNASIDDDSCNPYTRSATYNNNNNMASSNYARNIFPPMIVNSHQALDVQHKHQQQKNMFAYKVNPYKYACHRLRLSLLSPFPNEVMFALEFLHGLSQAECAMNELQHLTTQLQLQQQILTTGNKDAWTKNHYQELILQYQSLNKLLHGNQKRTSVSNQPAAPDLNVYYTFLIDIFKGVVAQQQKIAPDQVTSIPSYYAFLNTCGQIKMLDAVIETVLPAELFVETPFDQEDLNINSSKTVKDNNNLGNKIVSRIANDPFYMAIKQFWKHQIDSTTKDLALCPSTDNNSILIRLAIVIDIIRNWSFLPGNGHAMANNITCIRFLIVICRACKLSADFINSTQDIVSNISKYMDLSSLSKQDPRITKLFLTIFLDGAFDNRFQLTRSLEIYGNLCYQPEQNMSHLLMHLSDEVCQQIIQQLLRDSDVAVLCRTLETLYQITFYGKDTLNDRIADVTGSIDILINLLKFKSSSHAITKMNISFPIRVEQKVQTNNNTYMPPSQQAKFLINKNNNPSQSLHYQPQRVGPPSRPSSQLAMLQQSNPQGAPLMFQSQNMTSNANAFNSNPILIGLEAGTGDHHTPQSKDLNATKMYYQNDLKHTFSINTHLAVGNNNNNLNLSTQTLLTTPNNTNLPADRLLANRMGDGPSHHLNHQHFGLSSQRSCRSNRDILREVGYSKSNRVKRHPMPQNIESPGAFNHNVSHYNSNSAAKLNESTYSASTPLSVKQEENVSIDSDSRDQTSIVNTPQKFARNSDGGGNLFKTPTNSSPGVRSLGSSGGSAPMFGRSYNSGSERSVKHSSPSISFSANNKLHFEAARYAERWFRAYYEPGPGLTPRAEMLNCYFTYGRRFFRESFRPLKYTSLCNCIKRALPSGKLIRRIRDNGQLQVLVEGIRKRAVPLPLDKVPQLTPQEYSLNLKKRSTSPCTMRDDELYGDKITDEKNGNDLNITTSPNAGGHIIKDTMSLENFSKLPLLGGTSSQDLSTLPKIKDEIIFDSSCNDSNFDARQYQQQTPPYPNSTMHGDRDSVLLPINHIPSNIVSPFSLQAQTLVVGDNMHSTCSNTSVSQRGRPKKVMKSAVTNLSTTIVDLNGTSHQSTNSLGGNSEPVRKHHGRPKGAFGVRKRRLLESLDPNSPEYKKIQQGNLKFRKQSLDHIGKTLPLAGINKNLVNGSSSQLSDETSSSLKATLCSEQANKPETFNSIDSNASASCISQNIVDQTLSISTAEQCAEYTDSTNNSSILTSTNSTVTLFAETHSINVTSSLNATNFTGMSTQLAIDKTYESTLKISNHPEIKENIITNGCHNNSSLNHNNTLLVNTTQIETTNDEDSSNALLTDFPLLQARLQTNRTTTLFSTNSTSLSLVSNITGNIGSPITSTNHSDVSITKKSDTQLLDKILGFDDSKSPSTTHRQVYATEAKEMLEEQPMDIDIDINETVDSISTTLVHSSNNSAKDTRDINYNTSIQVSEQNGDISPDNVKETNLEDHGTEHLNHSNHSTHETTSSKAKINSGPQNNNAYPGINIEELGTDAMELDMEVMTSSTSIHITDDISPTNRVKQNGLNQNDEQSYHTITTDDTFQNTTCSHIIEDKPKENCNFVSIVSQLAETPANPSSSDSEKTCGMSSINVPTEKILKESPKQHTLNGLILPHYKIHKTHLEKVTHIHHVSLSSHTSTQQIPDQKVLISDTKNLNNVSESMENRDMSKNDYNIVTSVVDSILDNICNNLPIKSFNAEGIDGIETKDDIRLDPIKAYQCAWEGCDRKALTPQSLIAHIYFDHATVPESSINESLNHQIHSNIPTVCLWKNCNQNYMGKYFMKTPQQQQLIARQKYSLANHLLETHCTPAQIAKLELCITDPIEIQNILSSEKSNASHLKYEMKKETKYGPPDQAAIQTMYRYFAQSLSNTPYLAEELGLNIGNKTNDVEYNLNLNVRYMAALVLRNIAVNSPRVGQRKIKLYEHVLVSQAFTPTDISKIISQILWEIQSNSLSRHIGHL